MTGLKARGKLCEEPPELFKMAHHGRSQKGIRVGAISTVRMVANASYSFVLWRFRKGSIIRA